MTRLVLALAAFGVAAAACDRSVTRGDPDAQALQIALAQATPVGSSIDSARHFMEGNGFACQSHTDGTFVGLPTGQRADFLWCDKSTTRGIVRHRWQTVHVDTAGRVRSVFAFDGLIAP